MVSQINPLLPENDVPASKADLRANLGHAKDEIEALQAIIAGMGSSGVTVANVAALQALEPTEGAVVSVLGYHAPGDGGGGVFYADMDNAVQTDGGCCFGYTGADGISGDLSAEQSVSGLGFQQLIDPYDFPDSNLAFGTVTASVVGYVTSLNDWQMPGHRMNAGESPILPWIDHAAGRWQDPNRLLAGWVSDRSTTATITYRYLTQPRRWVRLMMGHAIDVRWFGAQPETDARNRICAALNAAKRLGKQAVRLNGNYRYAGSIEIPDGVFFGWGRIKIADGRAVPWLHNDYTAADSEAEPLVVTNAWGHGVYPESGALTWGLIRLEIDGNCLQAELDGSSNVIGGNLYPLQNPELFTDPLNLVGVRSNYISDPPDPENDEPELVLQMALQNTPTWCGVSHSNHGGRVVPEGQLLTIEDVHIHGTGSNTMGNYANTYVSGRNLKLGNSARNHLFYSLHGAISGLTLYGFAWGSYGKTEGCNISGLEVNKLVDGQAVHGFAAGFANSPNLIAYEGERWGPDAVTGAEDPRWGQRKGLNIDGFNIDLEGLPVNAGGPLFSYTGQQMVLQNGVILGPKVSSVESITVLAESHKGSEATSDAGLYNGIWLKGVRLMQRGSCAFALQANHDLHADQSGFEDVSIEDTRGHEDTAQVTNRPIKLLADTHNRADPKYGIAPRQMHFRGITYKPRVLQLIFADVRHADAHALDAHFSNCVFPVGSNAIVVTESGTGAVAGITAGADDAEKLALAQAKLRLHMDRCRFTMGADGAWGNYELFFAVTRLRDCATLDAVPLVSEAAGLASLTAAGGETSLDVATKLLWDPEVLHVTPRSAAGAARFAYAEVLAKDGSTAITGAADKREPVLRLHFDQALGAGEVISLGWDAAVRPF